MNAVRNALMSKKSKLPSPVKSAVGSSLLNAERNAEISKKSSTPSVVMSAGQVLTHTPFIEQKVVSSAMGETAVPPGAAGSTTSHCM